MRKLAFHVNIHQRALTACEAPNNQVDKTAHSVYVSENPSPTTPVFAQ